MSAKQLDDTYNMRTQGAYHGVPLVGMPLFAEQPDNIARAIDRGFALSVSVKKLAHLGHRPGAGHQQDSEGA